MTGSSLGLDLRLVTPKKDELTPLGRSLWEPVEALGAWARGNIGEIEAARGRFDARSMESPSETANAA